MTRYQRRKRKTRELAAVWASILASDRATDAWGIKLIAPAKGPPALRLAWRMFMLGQLENNHERSRWRPGVTYDTAAERWARAESIPCLSA